ncbi:MAG: N-acetyltransferase [Candidatus Omnitrophica bacterium]|nr:N-acetyltransferase [Candidatus Omnitrophota bacterium]
MIRKATIRDIKALHTLINQHAKDDYMLPRSLNELYENIRDFWVFVNEANKRITACCALHISWGDLAEIKSLAVINRFRSRGIGSALVLKAMEEARSLGIKNIFVLTYVPKFFKKFGFRRINRLKLPHKIWLECCNCPKFPDCKEIALLKKI